MPATLKVEAADEAERCQAGGYGEEVRTPTENDLIISRLVARVAELEEKLYKRDLEAPAMAERSALPPAPAITPITQPAQPKLKDAILSTLKTSWAKFEALQTVPTPEPEPDPGRFSYQPALQPNRDPSLTPVRALTPQSLPGAQPQPQQQRQQEEGGDEGRPSWAGARRADADVWGATSSSSSSSSGGTEAAASPSASAAAEPEGRSSSFQFKTHLVVNYDRPLQDVPPAPEPDAAPPKEGASGTDGRAAEAGGRGVLGTASAAAAAADTAAAPPKAPASLAGSNDGGTGGAAGGSLTDWFAKLSLPWGRDRQQQQAAPAGGVGLSRDVSTGSLQQYGQQYGTAAYAPGASSSYAFNEKALEERLTSASGQEQQHYYRYVFDPVDVQAEMEVTARVRRAAAEALMEANAKLAEAQEAQAQLQAQLQEAKELASVVDHLRAERSAISAAKAQVEGEVMAVRAQLEEIKGAETSLQAELEAVRSQADIWRSGNSAEAEKLKQENTLLRNQLNTRLSELQACRTRLTQGEAERQRMAREAEELLNKIQWLTKINLQLEGAESQVDGLRKAAAEWQERFMRERNVRRRLHDQLQQLKGNIRVMCRVRPVLPGQKDIVTYPLEGLLAVTPPDRRYQEFEFDHVFGPGVSQALIFDEAVSPLVRSCADGFNVCILAYGQTGSGKTYTMQGGRGPDAGINVRALQELFRIALEEGAAGGGISLTLGAAGTTPTPGTTPTTPGTPGIASPGGGLGRWSFSVSMLEIYNEAVHDLLAGAGGEGVAKAMDVSGLGAGELPAGVDRVPGLTWRPVATSEDVEAVLREGSRSRATASTALNASSSRSHALLTVRVACTHADGRVACSTMHLVDLAGSERVDKSEVAGQQLREAQSINKSLSALGDVIAALQRRNAHIPFRNSKLTSVLQDSLSGNSKVLLVCNLSPESGSASETISSLNFASRAAQVELGAARRVSASPSPSGERSPAPGPPAPPGLALQLPTAIVNGSAAKVRAAQQAGLRASQQAPSPGGLRG